MKATKIMTRMTRFFGCPPTTNFLIEFSYPAIVSPSIAVITEVHPERDHSALGHVEVD